MKKDTNRKIIKIDVGELSPKEAEKYLKKRCIEYGEKLMKDMKRYEDYNEDNIPFTKFVIVVPSEDDKMEIQKALRYLHDSDLETDYIAVNQIVHGYLSPPDSVDNIIVDPDYCSDIEHLN